MKFEQAFLKVKEKFDGANTSDIADFAIQVTLTDEDCGGTFYAEVKDGKLSVEPYDYYNNDVVLNITKAALLSVLSSKLSIEKAIANGNAHIKGDVSKIADLKKTIKKPAAKKATTKKTSTKKTTSASKTTSAKTTAKTATASKETTPKTATDKTVSKKTTNKKTK